MDFGEIVGVFVDWRVAALRKQGEYRSGPGVEADHRTGFTLRTVEVHRGALVAIAELVDHGGGDRPVEPSGHAPTLAALRAGDLAGHHVLRAVERIDRRIALPARALENVHPVVDVVIGLDGELIGVATIGEVENVAGGVQTVGARAVVVVGRGIEFQQRSHGGIDTLVKRVVGDDVVLINGSTGRPLVDPLQRRRGRDQGVLHALGVGADTLIVAENEKLIVLDRAAERTTEVVLDQHGNGNARPIIEEVVGVEVAVAEVVEPVAVKLVGASAGDELHLPAGAAAVFRLAPIGHDAGFLHRVGVVRGER